MLGSSFNLFKKPKNESSYRYKEVNLMFPTFQVKSKFNAVEAMKTLGLREVFISGAELDKITAGGPIGIRNILHEAVVEVTKDGVEAAAATGIELKPFYLLDLQSAFCLIDPSSSSSRTLLTTYP